jgi:hypothetical protein
MWFGAVLWVLLGYALRLNPEFPLEGAMIAQGFGFTGHFLRERNTPVSCRLKKMSCGFKQQARARRPMENLG